MKFALIGYGKMGRMIEEIALSRGHEIVSIIDVDNLQDFDSDAFRSADVAIEFTAPQVAYDNYLRAFAQGVKVVSGSTGWLKDHGDDVRRMCEKEGKTLFWSSNFSLGVTVFRAVNRYLARIMNRFPDYTPSLSETHHVHKLDYPSGTAITLAEELIAEDDALDGWYVGEAQPRCPASTALPGRATLTPSPSPTTPTRAGALPWVQCWLLNTPPPTRVCLR